MLLCHEERTRGSEESMAKKNKSRLIVVSKHGRHRFQRGLVTASFLQRNLNIDEAMILSAALKRRFDGREEVTTEEILAVMEEFAPADEMRDRRTRLPLIRSEQGISPFSKGVFLRSLTTAGLEVDQAYEFAESVDRWMVEYVEEPIDQREFNERVTGQLRAVFGSTCARRYGLADWIYFTSKPVVILIAGATGTGKSTLAMELAARLRVPVVTGTDMIRETLRTVLSAQVVPGLPGSEGGTPPVIVGGRR